MILYTPQEMAIFLFRADLRQSEEWQRMLNIWTHEKSSIAEEYRDNFALFRRDVHLEMFRIHGNATALDELSILLRDTQHAHCVDGYIDEQGVVEGYFKVIRLSLMYGGGNDYRKIKLRKVLKQFGYKRRSAKLVNHMQDTLSALGLKTYRTNLVPCNIADIDIDEMCMIRL